MGASASKTPRLTAPQQSPAVFSQRPLHAPLFAGSVGSLATVDENLHLDFPELIACEENPCDDHRLYDDDDETYTYEMETAGMKKELERLKEFGLYSATGKDSRDPGGCFITTTCVKKATITDWVKTCRTGLVCRDFKWRDPHVVGLFAPCDRSFDAEIGGLHDGEAELAHLYSRRVERFLAHASARQGHCLR